jgi:hypothetical protein
MGKSSLEAVSVYNQRIAVTHMAAMYIALTLCMVINLALVQANSLAIENRCPMLRSDQCIVLSETIPEDAASASS